VAAMPIIAQLLQGKPLTEEFWSPEKLEARTYTWARILPNSLTPGDVVRVRHDAYTGTAASHNGKLGYVSALRGGVIVVYTDKEGRGVGMGTRHEASALERQVPIRTTTRGATQ
jgi:hypothetical protein